MQTWLADPSLLGGPGQGSRIDDKDD